MFKTKALKDDLFIVNQLLQNCNIIDVYRLILAFILGAFLEISSIYVSIPFFNLIASNDRFNFESMDFYKKISDYYSINSTILIGIVFITFLSASNFFKLYLTDTINKFSFSLGDTFNEELLNIFLSTKRKSISFDNSIIIDAFIQKNSILVFGTIMPLLQVIYGTIYIFALTVGLIIFKGTYVFYGFLTILLFYYIVAIYTKPKITNSSGVLAKCSEDRTSLITNTINNYKNIIIDNKISKVHAHNNLLNLMKNSANSVYYHYGNLPRLILELLIWILVFLFLTISSIENTNSNSFSSLSLTALIIVRLLPVAQQVYANMHSLKISSSASLEYLYFINSNKLPPTPPLSSNINNANVVISKYDLHLFCNFIAQKNFIDNSFLFKNLSIEISPAKWYLLSGPSGCGKSTLMNILIGLSEPSTGKVLINGFDLSDHFIKTIYFKSISYVQQRIFLTSGTILDNILSGSSNCELAQNEIDTVLKCCNLNELINSLPHGINTYINENGTNLSGGQIQKIGIACALIKMPSILFLDESTSAIDQDSEFDILRNIRFYYPELTLVMITHNPNIHEFFDQIIDLSPVI